ncbi:MAG TPA: prepilin-type N-terminal cleavage/methylation domain-containing protein [Patescibacteria group bacterium]|nr:prepilin-type N-terminal cleavage/methylation domain-containing protein [Patescibacteria group bacterium]
MSIRARAAQPGGFSLLELLVGMAILLVVLATVLSVLAKYEQIYQGQQVEAGVELGLNSALELLSQEIGQAGYLGFAPRTLQSAVIGSSMAQTVPISSTDSLFAGEKLLVDAGVAQELVTVVSVGSGTITGIFAGSHASGAFVTALGVFSTGVLSTANGNTLQLFGDINADGSLVFVQYTCNLSAGALTRTVSSISASAQNPAQPLLTGLVANPGGTPCFEFNSTNYLGTTYVTGVKVTLSNQGAMANPQTGQPPVMTASLAIVPRNVLRALAFAQMTPPETNLLEPAPPGLPLP